MSFDTYQQSAKATAKYPGQGQEDLAYPVLGLNGEAGEVAEVWKKVLRDDDGILTADKKQRLVDELGDVLWYAAQIATELNVPLSDVATRNLEKLSDRAERGKLGGSGDNR